MKKTIKATIEDGKLILVETTEFDSGGDIDLRGLVFARLSAGKVK